MSTEVNLNFAKIIIIENNLAEIIINPDVEVTLDMVHKLHETLCNKLTAYFFLLFNKINSYSFNFDAMHELCTIEEIKGIAFICYSEKSEKNAEYLASLSRKKPWNSKTFNDREAGLDWVTQQK